MPRLVGLVMPERVHGLTADELSGCWPRPAPGTPSFIRLRTMTRHSPPALADFVDALSVAVERYTSSPTPARRPPTSGTRPVGSLLDEVAAAWRPDPDVRHHRHLAYTRPRGPTSERDHIMTRSWFAPLRHGSCSRPADLTDLYDGTVILTDKLQERVVEFVRGPGRRAVDVNVAGSVPLVVARHEADMALPAASLLKPLVVEAVLQHVPAAEQFGRPTVRVQELRRTSYPTILAAFEPTKVLSVREVCALSLITSDNTCAQYLLEEVLGGVDPVNQQAEALGLTSTRLMIGFSDDDLRESGRASLTSASDMSRFFLYLWSQRRGARAYMWDCLLNNLRNQRIPGRLPDDVPVAHKTGTLRTVCNDAGVVMLPTGALALSVLMDDQPDVAEAANDLSHLARDLYVAVAEGRRP